MPNTTQPSAPTVYVWDRLVRTFHWTLATCVLLNLTVIDDESVVHHWLGYLACASVGVRLVWGLIGSQYARFANFWPTPARLRTHLKELKSPGQAHNHLGHNPLGGLMMLGLMAVVLLLGLTGWLQTTDAFWGEEWLEELHETLADGLMLLIGLHVAAAIVMSRISRSNLIRAMITGYKNSPR